jgi:hypothetical protein
MTVGMPLGAIEFGSGDGNTIELLPRQRNGYFTFVVRGLRGGVKARVTLSLDDIREIAVFAEKADLSRRVLERSADHRGQLT